MANQHNFVTVALLLESSLAIAAIGLGWLLHQPPLESIDLSSDRLPHLGSAILAGLLATLPLLAGLLLYNRLSLGFFQDTKEVVDQLIVPLFRQATVFDIAAVSVAAGLGEEMLFRGLLQTGVAGLAGGDAGVFVGLLVSSIVFGLCHSVTPLYAVMAGLVGVYLGGLFIFSESLAAPIVCHAAYDFVALMYFCKWNRK